MTDIQATELLTHLTKQLERYGFGEILRQANSRTEESFVTIPNLTPRRRLKSLLFNVVQILQSISSFSVPEILSKINSSLISGTGLEGISIQLITGDRISLSDLPNYTALIEALLEIFIEINEE